MHRAFYDSNNLPEAKRTLLNAIHVAPMDHRLRFNLAVVMQARDDASRKDSQAAVDEAKMLPCPMFSCIG